VFGQRLRTAPGKAARVRTHVARAQIPWGSRPSFHPDAVADSKRAGMRPRDKAKKPKKRAAGHREMLLPIAGKGIANEKAKEPAKPAARQREAWAKVSTSLYTIRKRSTRTIAAVVAVARLH
jgi:hypothetical protein